MCSSQSISRRDRPSVELIRNFGAQIMTSQISFYLDRLRERLWVRPLAFCVLSVAGVFVAKKADGLNIGELVPEISPDSIETLLSIIAASMLVVATFAVGSMISAFASASGSATPRSFPLVVSDDVSQNALSTFIGAFIFSYRGVDYDAKRRFWQGRPLRLIHNYDGRICLGCTYIRPVGRSDCATGPPWHNHRQGGKSGGGRP